MVYAKAMSKSNGDRASSCVKTFLIGNMSDNYPDSPVGFIHTQYYLPVGGNYVDIQEVGLGDRDRTDPAQDRDRWRALVNSVITSDSITCGEFLDRLKNG
jgi:hypothetical protein